LYVFNSSQKWLTFWYKLFISSVEVYDKHIIACHFSYHTLYQPSFIYHPLSLLALGLIKGMIWKMPCNNLYLSCLKIKGKMYKSLINTIMSVLSRRQICKMLCYDLWIYWLYKVHVTWYKWINITTISRLKEEMKICNNLKKNPI
jgi:hypothetical protein